MGIRIFPKYTFFEKGKVMKVMEEVLEICNEWRSLSEIRERLRKPNTYLPSLVHGLFKDGHLERRKVSPLPFQYHRRERVAVLESAEDIATQKGIRARIEVIQDKLVKELEARVTSKKIGHLSNEELNSLMKTCRENIKAINEAEVVNPSEAMTVKTVLSLDEEGESEGESGGKSEGK